MQVELVVAGREAAGVGDRHAREVVRAVDGRPGARRPGCGRDVLGRREALGVQQGQRPRHVVGVHQHVEVVHRAQPEILVVAQRQRRALQDQRGHAGGLEGAHDARGVVHEEERAEARALAQHEPAPHHLVARVDRGAEAVDRQRQQAVVDRRRGRGRAAPRLPRLARALVGEQRGAEEQGLVGARAPGRLGGLGHARGVQGRTPGRKPVVVRRRARVATAGALCQIRRGHG
ncbi:MAG: hypothetical protein U1F43_07725 [Myxococcota bacterium]